MNPEEQALEELTGKGGDFEVTREKVKALHQEFEEFEVFTNRFKSLRELVAFTQNFKDREFLILEKRRYTYQNFFDLVAALADTLKTDFDIKKGDRVALYAANSPEWVVTFFATVCIGAIVTAFNGHWTNEEVQYGISHSTPKLIVGDTKRLERIDKTALKDIQIVNLDTQFHTMTAKAPEKDLPTDELLEDDPCLILYTSGTTGKPKGAITSHRGLIGFIQTQLCNVRLRMKTAELMGYPVPTRTSQSISLGTSPLFHVSGLHGTLMMNIATGGKIIYRPGRFDPTDILETIQKEKITQFSALGNAGHQLCNHPDIDKYDISSIQSVGFGGAPASPTIQQLIRDTFPNAAKAVGMGYGSSETCAVVASIGGAEFEAKPESCGKVSIGMELEIRDKNENHLPSNEQGEIHCRSAYMMLGYWGDKEATQLTIKPGNWLATGDIGHLDENGYLYINSRARDMILKNAENIYPIEIEYLLDSHPDVAESAVIGIDHPEMGQEVMAVIVPKSLDTNLDTNELADYLAKSLASYKIPTAWEIRTKSLPRNPAGKILKLELH